ncbi:hypothetical protein L9F63_014653, partial [Diploptera punctata]
NKCVACTILKLYIKVISTSVRKNRVSQLLVENELLTSPDSFWSDARSLYDPT